MGRQKQGVATTHREKLPAGVKESWIPAGYETESVLAGQGWKPETGESRAFEITGYQKKEGKIDGKKTEYLLITGADLTTGEEFVFIPGGLFQYMMNNETLLTGDAVSVTYLGRQKLASGFSANNWKISKLRKK
jgi:hypothetical protein